jgi:hypothetical protein
MERCKECEVSELMQQHERWSDAQARLWGVARHVTAVPEPRRPVSPFERERRARIQAKREAFERQMANVRGMGVLVAPIDTAGGEWPPYTPPVRYDHYEAGTPRKSAKLIAQEVCAKHGVSFNDIMSPRRNREVVTARQEAFWRCRKETTLTLPQIGRFLGGKDHTTVLWGIKMYEKRLGEAGLLLTGEKPEKAQQG